jgi:hypothetical protein
MIDAHLLLLTMKVMLLIAAVQAGAHSNIWQWKLPSNHPLRPMLIGIVAFCLGVVIWDVTLILQSAAVHAMPRPLTAIIDIFFFGALWLMVISSWMIDYQYGVRRVLRCLFAQTGGALCTALLLNGIFNL